MADELEDEQEQEQRIARPQPSLMPPVAARGLSAPPEAAPVGSTSDLENQGLASHLATRPIASPSPLEVRTTADQTELSRLQDTGSGVSQIARAHPVAGNILRGLNTVGTVASALVPGLHGAISAIPGTEEHHNQLLRQETGRIGEDLGEEQKEAATAESGAKTEQEQAAAEKDRAAAAEAEKGEWQQVNGLTGPNGEPIEHNSKTGEYRAGSLTGLKSIKQPGETQEQNKLAFQSVIAKLDKAGLPSDPKQIDKSLDAALKKNIITAEEHAAARSYQSANPTPGTNLTVHIAGQEEGNRLAINKLFEGKEVLAHMPDGSRVLMSYDQAKQQNIPPERLVAMNSKEAQDTRDKSASVKTTFQGLDRYRSDLKDAAPKLTETDRDALRALTAHTEQTAGALSGLIDELPLAGPLTSYANKLMEGTMTSDQYKQLSPAGKKLVSDYFTSVIDNFANMKAIMGSVGRNPMQLQAEINTIPLPYLDWDSAAVQFDNKRGSLQGRASSMPQIYEGGQK